MGNSSSQPNSSSLNTSPGTLASQEPHQISSQIVADALHTPSSPNPPVATFSSHPKPQLSPLQPSPAIKPTVFYVPRNARQILDFSHDSPSPESQAMKALLSNRPNQNAIALVGMGGAGKTTILRALGRNADVWTKFPDGVWFIELGHDASVQKLLEQLEDLVVDAFPDFVPKFTRLASKDSSHLGMMERLADLLTPKRFLLIFDDVWDLDPNVYNLIDSMCKAVQETDGVCCKVLTSTRNEAIGRVPTHDVSISVSPEHSSRERCIEILCCYAGIDSHTLPTLSSANVEAVNKIIEFCAGLPLALSVAGSAMQDLFGRRKDGCGQDAIAQYWESLKKSTVQLSVAESGGRHVGLGAAIQSSLVSLEKNWTGKGMGMGEMFESFCVVEKQMILPLYVIEKLWDTIDGVPGVRMLSRHSLISLEQDEGGSVWGVRLHDLVHDMCVEMAEGREGVGKWHGRLVDGYLSWMGRRRSGKDEENEEEEEWNGIGENEWWKVDRTDKYMRDNVVRHLLGAGRLGAGLRLLSDYRWIEEMNEDKDRPPFRKVITELHQLRLYIEKHDKTETGRNVTYDVSTVVRAMELSMPYSMKNRRECTFQLYGRLRDLTSKSRIIEWIMYSIEQYGRRPWARAEYGVLTSGSSPLIRVLDLDDNWGLCMCVGSGGDEVVVGGKGGKVWVLDGHDGSRKKTLAGYNDSEKVLYVFVDKSSSVIYSCSSSGKVIIWKEYEEWRSLQAAELETEEEIICMKVLPKPERVVLGTNQGRLVVMDVKNESANETKDATIQEVQSMAIGGSEDMVVYASNRGQIYLRGTSKVLEGHTKWITSMAFSSDGELLASASGDKTVRLWDVQSGKKLCALPGDSRHDRLDKRVLHVLLSDNGRLLYSVDRVGKICAWQVGSGGREVSLRRTLILPSSRCIVSVCIGNGSELFALHSNRVEVCDMRGFGSTNERQLDAFLPGVSGLSVSADGATMLTEKRVRELLEVRNVCDVSRRADRIISSFKYSGFIGALAVSNNQQFVAYVDTSRRVANLVDARNGNVLHLFSKLQQWTSSPTPDTQDIPLPTTVSDGSDDATGACANQWIDSLRFNSDSTILSATVSSSSGDNSKIRKSLSWNVATGKLLDEPHLTDDSHAPNNMESSAIVCEERSQTLRMKTSQHETYEHEDVPSTIATLQTYPAHTCFCPITSRLWLSSLIKGVQYVDLITDTTQLPPRHGPPPTLPSELLSSSSPGATGVETELDEVYDVFISHAGTDKLTIAEPLYDLLVALGLKVFLDKAELRPGQNASQKMIRAMQTAKIAVVILSPEFAARKWTLKELMCFLERFRAKGERGVIIIPVFYRLTLNDCWDESTLFRLKNEKGQNVFVAEGFLERMAGEQEYGIGDVVKTLQSLRGITGIENKNKVTNGTSVAEKEAQTKFVREIGNATVEAKKRLNSGRAAGPSGA